MATATGPIPPRVLGLYHADFWSHLREHRRIHLQRCAGCGAFRYPPGPVCHACLSPAFAWEAVAGTGEILSYVIFHRQYLPAYPAPYNVIAVRLDEGPIMMSNLEGRMPGRSDIGRRVMSVPVVFDDGDVLPRFSLA